MKRPRAQALMVVKAGRRRNEEPGGERGGAGPAKCLESGWTDFYDLKAGVWSWLGAKKVGTLAISSEWGLMKSEMLNEESATQPTGRWGRSSRLKTDQKLCCGTTQQPLLCILNECKYKWMKNSKHEIFFDTYHPWKYLYFLGEMICSDMHLGFFFFAKVWCNNNE